MFVEVPDYSEFDELRKSKQFRKLMDEAIQVRLHMEEEEARLKEIKEELEAELRVADVQTTISYQGWQLRVVDKQGSKKLDKKLLLKLLGSKGVEIMKKATVIGPPSHYVALTSPKENKEVESE